MAQCPLQVARSMELSEQPRVVSPAASEPAWPRSPTKSTMKTPAQIKEADEPTSA